MAEAFVEELRAVHPLYGAIEDPEFNERMVETSQHSVEAFSRWLADGAPALGEDDVDYYRTQAADAARQLVPLEALQEPIRVGGRVLWRWLIEACRAIPDAASVAVDLLDELSRFKDTLERTLTDTYVEVRFQPDGAERQLRRDLVETLLDGRALGPEVHTKLAASFGLAQGGRCVVVVTRARNGGRPPEPQLVVDTAQERSRGHRWLVADRENELVAVVPLAMSVDELVDGVTEWLRQLRRIHGLELLVGISTPGELGDVPDRYTEAHAAMRYAASDDDGLVALPRVRLFDHLLSRVDGTTQRMIPASVLALHYEDQRREGVLLETLTALADADLNVARAAGALYLHPNTVHYRLRVIAELSGKDPRSFRDLADLLIALRCIGRDAAQDTNA